MQSDVKKCGEEMEKTERDWKGFVRASELVFRTNEGGGEGEGERRFTDVSYPSEISLLIRLTYCALMYSTNSSALNDNF